MLDNLDYELCTASYIALDGGQPPWQLSLPY